MKTKKSTDCLLPKLWYQMADEFIQIKKCNYNLSEAAKNDDGFSLIEIIVVFLMIGILAAIALPSWFGFIKQQRINKANNAVLAAIQEAQQQAKKKKLSYSVSFKVKSNVPMFVVHPDSESASGISDERWKKLGEDLGINPQQVTLLTNLATNLTDKNTVATAVDSKPSYLNTPQTISFDYMGTLSPIPAFKPADSTKEPELKIVVAGSVSGSSTSTSGVRRCVIIRSLLGSMVTGKGNECN